MITEPLNINKLIEAAERLWYGEPMQMAARGAAPVQTIVHNGLKYQLQVVLTSKEDEFLHKDNDESV
jgi:hypothetical protein